MGLASEDATWEDESFLTSQFPDFGPEDKAADLAGGIDRNENSGEVVN